MKLGAVIKRLQDERPELERLGAKHALIFGSLARGDATIGSDIDIAVELDVTRRIGLTEFFKIQDYLQALFSANVDVVGLPIAFRPALDEAIKRDGVAAF